LEILNSYKLIFWDFDGVIKDSIEVKTQAFIDLFKTYGLDITEKIRNHHESHGGMSRFDKIPLYLEWAGLESNTCCVNDLCNKFSQLVIRGVINASFVSGAEFYLRKNCHKQIFILVSATPYHELKQILHALNLFECFVDIYGAPTQKKDAISMALEAKRIDTKDCLMIGDSKEDYHAAKENDVSFLLRRHSTNSRVFLDYDGPFVNDFNAL